MRHPATMGLFLALITATTAAEAGPDPYVPTPLPAAFDAELDQPDTVPHTPKPFPGDEEDLSFQGGSGASPWVVIGSVLATGAAVSGLVAAGAQARLGSSDLSGAQRNATEKTRNNAGYTAIGLAGGSLVFFGVELVR